MISLRRVEELAIRLHPKRLTWTYTPTGAKVYVISEQEAADTAAALEALVKLVEAGMALNETADAWLHTQFFEEDGDADAAGVRAEDAKLAYHIALAQFIDDREKKP